jgi:ABC-type phosphate transport system substrate-binding protein
MFKRIFTLAAMTAAIAAAPGAVQAQGYQVVVHAGTAVSELPKAAVSKIFLKQSKTFPGGGAAHPVDQDRASSARAGFSTAVHGKSVASIEEFWLQQVFAGKDEPPAQQKDDAAVIAYVGSTPGAIGYVSASAAVSGNVKKVAVTP